MYKAPLKDIQFLINHVLRIQTLSNAYDEDLINDELCNAILDECAKFTENVLAPINKNGDIEGAKLDNNQVITATGFREAYQQFIEAGWNSLIAAPEYGGQGLPILLSAATEEMWHSANMSFTLCPLLTRGAIETIEYAASVILKQRYLPMMIQGTWTGTMNLTEPQAGSDLAAIKTKAERQGDHYKIYGQKIYITYGDHDLAENIIHLVLARLPDAPPGIKGISLFVVPKFLVNEDGSLGPKNDVTTVSLEHKLGIHGSPTCVLSYGDKEGAIGYLVGEENRGIEIMFVMMNAARFSVGVQGFAIAEGAYQAAFNYANERKQGIPIGAQNVMPIVHHADVAQTLLGMKTRINACRHLAYYAAKMLDLRRSKDTEERQLASQRSDLLTPIVKGFCTEIGNQICYDAIQVFGGMGYVEETGIAQYFRDARITTIYEGTTGIQANDLLGRKILRDNGESLNRLYQDIETTVILAQSIPELNEIANTISRALDSSKSATQYLLTDPNSYLKYSHANNLLNLLGWLTTGWLSLEESLVCCNLIAINEQKDYCVNKLKSLKFYINQYVPRSHSFATAIVSNSILVNHNEINEILM